MFRKPKRKVQGLRQKNVDDDEDHVAGQAAAAQDAGMGPADGDGDEPESSTTRELLKQARKRTKPPATSSATAASTIISRTKKNTGGLMQTYDTTTTSQENSLTARDLVTSTAEHHPSTNTSSSAAAVAAPPNDGIFRDTQRNAFHAGPIRAAASVRVTARFDYQPDICKDYKETGFCGFGDTCIYLHDRGDTLNGWQLEQQWEQEQKAKREQQQREMQDYAAGKKATMKGGGLEQPDDGLPFACHLCRSHFKHPVVTMCGHYFCEACIMNHVRQESEHCPICGKDTGSVFNQPTKLLAKKRKVLGVQASKAEDSWEQYHAKALASTGSS